VLEIEESSFQELLEALAHAQPTFDSKAVASEVASKVKTITLNDAETVVEAVFSLYSFRHYYDLDVDSLVVELTNTMEASEDAALKPSGNGGKFRERMSKLLNIESLGIASKA